MHYYQFNIGDYRRDTQHLSLLEHGIYRQLIDMYYLEESPLPSKERLVRLLCVRNADEERALSVILEEFFLETPGGEYTHGKCDKELEKYRKIKGRHWAQDLTRSERCAIQAARNAAKANATPKWLTAEHKRLIVAAYEKSRRMTEETGEQHEVDHAVPIRGKTVCGLHVPWNLQVIPAHQNRQKSNIEWGD